MALTRKSLFGFPPPPNQGSLQTIRMVPLTQGVKLDQPWTDRPAGSSVSMCNYLPLEGHLEPRSRLSSINTLRTFAAPNSIAQLTRADFGFTTVWLSNTSRHAMISSGGSISLASFTSANGLGSVGLNTSARWAYTQTYIATLGTTGENVLLAVPRQSADTIMALYQTAGSSIGLPLASYLTGAPKCSAIGVFDNYIIAFNTREGNVPLTTRVRWCQRGSPMDWTGEGSGYEDLLEMKGSGQAVVQYSDDRFLLFSDRETWIGIGATYPAQFDFHQLDAHIGCPFPETIAHTDLGVIFVGSDYHLRLLPANGGKSEVIAPSLSPYLRRHLAYQGFVAWGVYNTRTKMYRIVAGSTASPIVLNIVTGEWGFEAYNSFDIPTAAVGNTLWSSNAWVGSEGILYVNSSGTVFSTNSKIGTDSGSVVTSTFQSGPIAADLPGHYKQLKQVDLDYRATSLATVTLKVSQDGGNNYGYTAPPLSLTSAPVSGRATSQMYAGGGFPSIELTSTDTGYELHRIDATLQLGGHR